MLTWLRLQIEFIGRADLRQGRYAPLVAQVFVAEDGDQIALLQCDADENVSGRCGEQQVPRSSLALPKTR